MWGLVNNCVPKGLPSVPYSALCTLHKEVSLFLTPHACKHLERRLRIPVIILLRSRNLIGKEYFPDRQTDMNNAVLVLCGQKVSSFQIWPRKVFSWERACNFLVESTKPSIHVLGNIRPLIAHNDFGVYSFWVFGGYCSFCPLSFCLPCPMCFYASRLISLPCCRYIFSPFTSQRFRRPSEVCRTLGHVRPKLPSFPAVLPLWGLVGWLVGWCVRCQFFMQRLGPSVRLPSLWLVRSQRKTAPAPPRLTTGPSSASATLPAARPTPASPAFSAF